MVSDIDHTAGIRQVTFHHAVQISVRSLYCYPAGTAVIDNILRRPPEIFPVIAVAHLNQAAELSAHGRVVKAEWYAIAPHDIIKTVHIGLVHLLLIRARHTDQRLVIVHIHQRLSAGNFHHVPVRRCRIALLIQNRQLLRLHIHERGKLVEQQISLVTQFICLTARHLDGIDLFVHRRNILRDGVNLIYPNLNLIVHIRLEITKIPVQVIEIIRQRLRRAQKLRLHIGAAGIFRDFLQGHADLVKERLKARLVVVLQILLNHIAVIELRVVLAELRLIVPIFMIVEKIPHPLDRQCLHTCTRASVCGKNTQRVSRLRLYLLPAVARRLHIADIVARSVQRGIGRPKPR